MNYNEFCEAVVAYVSGLVDEACTSVRLSQVQKNNGVMLTGISIIDDSCSIGPTIYLENFYSDYMNSRSISDIATEIVGVYEANRCVELDVPVNFYMDFNQVKERLIYKVVNYEKNKEMLESVPHKRILDLALIFCCVVSIEEKRGSTVVVKNEHLKMWQVDEATVYEMALNNTPQQLPDRLYRIEDIIGIELDYDEFGINSPVEMYVLTNDRTLFGASVMLYDDVLKKLADQKKSDLYILPSSIHEVIVISTEDFCDADELREMVTSINATGVDPEDVLSDSVYVYNRTTESIEMA